MHIFYSIIAYIIIFTLTMSTATLAQVTYDDVVKKAVKKKKPQTNKKPKNTNSNKVYVPPPPPERTSRQQSDYNNSPAASRYRATQQQGQTPRVSASHPDAAWKAVKKSQPYGYKRNMRDLDEYSISEDDLLDATQNGVIDVNKIPSKRRKPQSSKPLGELCCPIGTSYYLGICTRVTVNRNISSVQYSEYSPGSKVPGGVCQGYRPIPGAVVVNK